VTSYPFNVAVLGADLDSSGEPCNGTPLDGAVGHSSSSGGSESAAATGFLSSHLAALHGHGTARCPWSITVGPGQRIDLTVIDFSLSSRYRTVKTTHGHGRGGPGTGHGSIQMDGVSSGVVDPMTGDLLHYDGSPTYCHPYATVTETGRYIGPRVGGGSFTLCAGDEREILAYSSQTNRISIDISRHAAEDPSANFIIKYTGKISYHHLYILATVLAIY